MYDQLTDQVGTQTYMSPEQLAQQSYNHKVLTTVTVLFFLFKTIALRILQRNGSESGSWGIK